MRDLKLKGEPFTFVRSIVGDSRITDLLKDKLSGIPAAATEYDGTLTIVCESLAGLGSLADIATDIEEEGPDAQFRAALGRAMAERIG